MEQQGLGTPLLESYKKKSWTRILWLLFAVLIFTIPGLVVYINSDPWRQGNVNTNNHKYRKEREVKDVVESEHGVVAADDGRCSEIGASTLRQGGHAVDAAVATALCLGVVNPMSSGIGGGGFMIVRSSSSQTAQAFDLRETAPLAATKDMYAKNPKAKYLGALSMGVPGEIAGLHEAWLKYGKLAWRTLCQPAIALARDGFVVTPYFASAIKKSGDMILTDLGLRQVLAPNGELLQKGDTCYNIELACTLEAIAEYGPQAFYNGTVGENFVKDVREAGGILTMEDLRSYKVEVMDAMAVDVMSYTILGMPPPSSGTVGLSLVNDSPHLNCVLVNLLPTACRLAADKESCFCLHSKKSVTNILNGYGTHDTVMNILDSYGTPDAVKGPLGLHRLIEALKHMFAIRMNLGDPDFINEASYVSDMLSPSFAKELREKIFDNTTFPSEYYMSRWSQLKDHGTSHFCIVDAERNAVSMTTTVNYAFGAKVLSPSTGIVLNNEMDDFSTPTEKSKDKLPPAPSNYIEPNKRPLSSMTPLIILKDDQLAGVIGGSGGMKIVPAVIQVFLNYYFLGMDPLAAVQHPRVYHELIPNVVLYENWTLIDGDHIELSLGKRLFLMERGHELKGEAAGAICQLVVQTIHTPNNTVEENKIGTRKQVFQGMLTAVSDPRKGPDVDDNEVSLSSFVEDLKPENENKSNNEPEEEEGKTRKFWSKAYSGGGGENLRNNNKAGELGMKMKKKGKSKTHWVCSNCGESFGQWWGGCRHCDAIGTLKVFTEDEDFASKLTGFGSEKGAGSWFHQNRGDMLPQRLTDVNKGINQMTWRIPLDGLFGSEVGRVLGGGLVPGSLVLVGGDPGVGKSTFLLQLAAMIAEGSNSGRAGPAIYVSGEESVEQIGNRADRMRIGTEDLFLYSNTDIEDILEKIQVLSPRVLIIDSIQTVYMKGVTGSPGGLVQVKECTSSLLRFAKKTNIPVLLIGHVTKTGDIAGPRVLEHIVDVVLYMEGEKYSAHRFLRSVKNRFGSTDEEGLQAVSNPSDIFLSEQHSDSAVLAGHAVAVIIDGSRSFLLEIQALCLSDSSVARQFNGVQHNRAEMIIAAIFVNVVSGVKLQETAGDLAIAAAVCSSFLDVPIPNDVAFIGEIGLAGELRPVPRMEKRVNALVKLGYKKCVVPQSTEKSLATLDLDGMMVLGCKNLKEHRSTLPAFFNRKPSS
ncbi:hypothetical protein IFM89_027952 [Coptis chinensis]|uniref:Glutathione hydrolase n=1 Tax=Coptis chinensis TaxID=261450 RepID=A0A835M1C1_9MAGN|nr:hypothetical protein IFM89_027952 [Coptis chinensis]